MMVCAVPPRVTLVSASGKRRREGSGPRCQSRRREARRAIPGVASSSDCRRSVRGGEQRRVAVDRRVRTRIRERSSREPPVRGPPPRANPLKPELLVLAELRVAHQQERAAKEGEEHQGDDDDPFEPLHFAVRRCSAARTLANTLVRRQEAQSVALAVPTESSPASGRPQAVPLKTRKCVAFTAPPPEPGWSTLGGVARSPGRARASKNVRTTCTGTGRQPRTS